MRSIRRPARSAGNARPATRSAARRRKSTASSPSAPAATSSGSIPTAVPSLADDLAGSGGIGTPAIADGMVFAATGLGGESGDPLGRGRGRHDGQAPLALSERDGRGDLHAAIVDERAVVVGHDWKIVALNAAAGSVEWTNDAAADLDALAVFSGSTVYVAGTDGPIQAIDVATGDVNWSVSIAGTPFAPAVADGYLLVGTDAGTLYAIGGPAR